MLKVSCLLLYPFIMDRRGSPGFLGPTHDASSRVQKSSSTVDKLAALKARVAAALETSQTKGTGLKVGLHPMLADAGQWKPPGQSNDNKNKHTRHDGAKIPSKQKPLDLSGPSQEEIKSNPYYDANITSGKPRVSRQLVFNQKGKYIQQANALRRQAALEAMKKRIAEQRKKAGIDDDLDVERNFVVSDVPDIEWWDEGLVDCGKNYEDIENPRVLKIDTEDPIITAYIQHPVPIEPPQDKNTPAPKPMYLTTKEQKKLRRQRRLQDLKEEQTKIRLGLVPAPPPKVKKGNLMRVLGEEAVKDPTAVEARVNKEIADRHVKHVEANNERKLTKEQKHEKLTLNQEKDAAKGLRILVFKINSLANGQHRYKIDMNAKQMNLTGICIMHPKQNLVIAEGGEHSIRTYKKLVCNRIDWAQNAPSRDKDDRSEALNKWLRAEDEKGELKDISFNKCQLIFEGDINTRGFRKWGTKVCETDAEARDALSRAKMDNFWNLAKSTQ